MTADTSSLTEIQEAQGNMDHVIESQPNRETAFRTQSEIKTSHKQKCPQRSCVNRNTKGRFFFYRKKVISDGKKVKLKAQEHCN